jgi:hypothetical protein
MRRALELMEKERKQQASSVTGTPSGSMPAIHPRPSSNHNESSGKPDINTISGGTVHYKRNQSGHNSLSLADQQLNLSIGMKAPYVDADEQSRKSTAISTATRIGSAGETTGKKSKNTRGNSCKLSTSLTGNQANGLS